MTEIIEHVFLFFAAIIGCIVLLCAVIIAILIALSFVFFLFSEYPIRTNFIIVIFLLILGIPILYIPVIYLVAIASIWTIIGLFVWIFPFDESNNVVKEAEPLSKEEVNVNITNKTTIEAEVPSNSTFIEDFNNTSHSLNYNSHPGIVLPFTSVPSNLNYNKYQEKIDSEAFKENNLSLIYDSGNYEDDDLCLKQEYIITFPATKIVEPSRLVALEIDAPDLIFLKPNQERLFTVHGIDQFGEYIDPGKIFWSATGGTINSQGRLIVENDIKGSFRVTAISSNAKVSEHRLRQNLLLIKTLLKIFSWVLSHKRFVKDTASYFIEDFCDSEAFVNEILPDIDTSNIDGLLTVLVFDDIKDWVIEAIVNVIIDCLDKFISLCFVEDFNPLICSISYVILPELKSQESSKVIETVESSFGTLNNNEIQSGSFSQRMKSSLLTQSSPSQTIVRQDIYLAKPYYEDITAELRRIRIVSYHKKINPVEIIQFQLLGTDQNGKDISIKAPIIWKTTDGQISSTGKLIVNDLNNKIQITATVGQLEAKTDMRYYRRYYTESDTFTAY
jgi:energy-coupling factor transporter transmembrane protein EcfT